jgi:hypothetical protein
VVRFPDGSIVAACDCDPWNCDDIHLKPDDVMLWEFHWSRFAAGVCRAFDFDRVEHDFGLPRTSQIGAWAANAVPVILTIQSDRNEFREVVAELAARMRDGFLLFAPTNRFMDAATHELLAHARAGFFAIESHLQLTPHGALFASRRAGELFAPWMSKPTVLPEETARQAFALVRTLDAHGPQREPSLLKVFRLYCVEALSAETVARRCGCSKATVINRLALIEQRTGADPTTLRAYSAQFEGTEASVNDPRARRISRREVLDVPEDEEETG